ncbi:hypothetical protein LCGC14_1389820 [marine sediment metagenome]|uniref:Uncharacterized protein n=1 Tax=marine sediment metagenome TaxID=412755 RepID=A0A0F9K0I2_9ZZZZ
MIDKKPPEDEYNTEVCQHNGLEPNNVYAVSLCNLGHGWSTACIHGESKECPDFTPARIPTLTELKEWFGKPPEDKGRLLTPEEKALANIIMSARTIQEYLWGRENKRFGFEEWRRMFRKRVVKLDGIDEANPYAMTELKKRVLQVGALAVALLAILDKENLPEHRDDEPPSNLPSYKAVKDIVGE